LQSWGTSNFLTHGHHLNKVCFVLWLLLLCVVICYLTKCKKVLLLSFFSLLKLGCGLYCLCLALAYASSWVLTHIYKIAKKITTSQWKTPYTGSVVIIWETLLLLIKPSNYHQKNIIVDGTHSPVECQTKPTFNILEAKSMTHLFRQIKGWNSNSPNLLQMVPREATKILNNFIFSFR